MRLCRSLIAFLFCLSSPLTAAVEAQDSIAQVNPAQNNVRAASLLAPCTESVVQGSPLSARPVVKRATFASKPKRPHARKATKSHNIHKKQVVKKKKHVVHKKHGKRPVRHAKRRPVAHRPASSDRPVMHRVTYASPLCGERTQAINDLIGLDNLDQLPVDDAGVVAAALPEDLQNVIFGPASGVTTPGNGNGGGTGPGTPGSPGFPGSPGTPGFPDSPVIIPPPVGPTTPPSPPISPPVTPPVTIVPEPSSWATMLLGMAFVGVAVRRRRKKAALER